jgi:hypothetical protein
MAGDSNLVRIVKKAFSDCGSLGSFCVPLAVEEVGQDCFQKCCCLNRVRFASADSLRKFVADMGLDFGFEEILSVFRIEFDD